MISTERKFFKTKKNELKIIEEIEIDLHLFEIFAEKSPRNSYSGILKCL